MNVSFLTPVAAVAGLLVLVPLAAVLLRERRARRVRTVLGTAGPHARAHVPVAVALLVAFALLAAAAAQPVVRSERTVNVRTDAEAFVVFDISRSMLASRAPDEPKRIERAIERGLELRELLGDLPVGVATLTDRALPNLFPTTDRSAFTGVVQTSIGVNRPPGSEIGPFRTATDFGALKSLASENFFAPDSTKRLVILLTDGESSAFAPRQLVQQLDRGGVDVVVVRFWDERERVWGDEGIPEPLYRPTRSSLVQIEQLAELTGAGRVFDESEPAATAASVRDAMGVGQTVPVTLPGETRSVAPWLVLAACVPFALLVLGNGLGLVFKRHGGLAYSMLAVCRAYSRTAAVRSRRAPASPPPS